MRDYLCLVLICLGLAACSPAASTEIAPTASPNPETLSCEMIVANSLQSLQTACNEVGRNEVCYGNRRIQVEFRENENIRFSEAGDRIPIENVSSLSLSPMNSANGEWGFALMEIQADLPDTLPGQNVTFLLFGGTSIEPQGEVDGLQAFYVRTGIGAASACNAVPDDGVLIQSPEGDIRATFSLNDVRLELGSTAYITVDENLHLRLLEGHAVITAADETQSLIAGQESSVPLDETGKASGAPSLPIAYETSTLPTLPLSSLPRSIEIAAPAVAPTATEAPELSNKPIPEFGSAENPDLGIVSGEIAEANETDVYRFNSTGNQAIYIDAQLMEGDIRIRLKSPSGEVLIDEFWLGIDYGSLLLEEAGEYTLEITGYAESTGAYQLQFWNVPAPNHFTVSLSVSESNDSEGLITGKIIAPAAKDIYEFEAEAGQSLFLDAQAMEGDMRASLISPSGTLLLDQFWLGIDAEPINLSETGTYQLEVFGYMDAVGTYELRLWQVPSSESRQTVIAEAIPNNEEGINQGELLSPRERHNYEFEAKAGQSIFLDAQGIEGDIRATLTSPDGTVLLDQFWLGIDAEALKLSESGRYTLAIFGNLDAVGSYQFQLWDVPPAETSTVSIATTADSQDGRIRSEILTPASSHLYTFEAEAGQSIFLDMQTMEGDIRASLVSPSGEILLDSVWLGIDSEPIRLAETGRYSLRVHGNLDAIGSVEFQLRTAR